MRINKIAIKNFRGFSDRQFIFDPKMNVVLGNNTTGKTTLLQAIQIALGAYLQSWDQLPKEPAFRKNFKVNDRPLEYNENTQDFVFPTGNPDIEVSSSMNTFVKNGEELMPDDNNVHWHREMKGSTTIHSRKNVGELMDVVKRWKDYRVSDDSNCDVILPIVLSFSADRIDNNYKRVEKETRVESRLMKAYKFALAETVDFKSALQWYYNYNSKGKKTPEVTGTDVAFEEALSVAARINNIAREEGNRTFWADVKVFGQESSNRLKYEMMSSGFKAMVNMVAEIAYRCIMLNRWLGRDAVKMTPGVVLIDEVDLYLHPHWQQHVLADLQEAFPNIQFIVSTHSPFIVQSVESKNVITLDGSNGSSSPTMRSIEDISVTEMNMDTARFPKYVNMITAAERYYQLVKSGKGNEDQLDKLKQELDDIEEEFSDDPAYVALLRAERNSK